MRAAAWGDSQADGMMVVVVIMAAASAQVLGVDNLTIYPGVDNLTIYRSPNASGGAVPLRLGYLTGSRQQSGDMYYRKPGQAISGAITMAVDEINAHPAVLPNHSVEFVIAETFGQEENSIRLTALLPLTLNISAYIGPQETCVHEGRIAAAFNLPIISYYCTAREASDKTLYPTFTRTKPHDSRISLSVLALLRKYSWRKVTFVYSSRLLGLADTMRQTLAAHGVNITAAERYEGLYFHDQVKNPFMKIVASTYTRTRIYLMLGEYYEFMGLTMALRLRGLLQTGDYFVVGVEIQQYDVTDPRRYFEGLFKDSSNDDVIASFRSFLGIAPAPPVYPDYATFSQRVNLYLEAAPFNFINPYQPHGILKLLRPEAAFLYDAVWLYARAAHAAVTSGASPRNGAVIAQLTRGTRYQSAMGYSMSIDENGDAEGNFTILGRARHNTSQWGIHPLGVFTMATANETRVGRAAPQLVAVLDEARVDWVSGRPPVDEPTCGFLGEKCIAVPNRMPQILAGALGGIVFVVAIIGVVVYRNWRYEQDLASQLWKIDYRDLVQRNSIAQPPTRGYSNTTETDCMAFRNSIISLNEVSEMGDRQVFTEVVTYRKQIVAIKHIHRKSVDVTRDVRKELKIIREIRNDNLNPFIGACVDPGHVCIVSEYCSKGSLQDILGNDDLKLDNMFIASLVFDLIKGMQFLHDSAIRSHGRLKSSNCVVDSRWVLKVTDFGLCEFSRCVADSQDQNTEHQHYQRLLWTAPELLRDACAPRQGSPRGDVYAFGIILYEIHGRNGPWGDSEHSPKDIIWRVANGNSGIPYRPRLGELGAVLRYITDTITDCWSENPLTRPDFKTIKNMLKPMQSGMKANILDNMMSMMEKYATNLEELVEERTDQLREEKKRTDALLHLMLPKSVAEQLKQGKPVEAEMYECVTIYFSDICGFTHLSSESTPIQVVELLNDLYTLFDSILEHYDVYKVETIGDAYMVVSGLPARNGDRHAGEIASMSLQLLCAIQRFRIRHRPQDILKLRIGIHSGACVAGVVGHKMPRYCLFGDTVNTASRMESNGLPLKIHCSHACKTLLDGLGGYQVEERGIVNMKGKGDMQTFWVMGEDAETRMARLKLPHLKRISFGENCDVTPYDVPPAVPRLEVTPCYIGSDAGPAPSCKRVQRTRSSPSTPTAHTASCPCTSPVQPTCAACLLHKVPSSPVVSRCQKLSNAPSTELTLSSSDLRDCVVPSRDCTATPRHNGHVPGESFRWRQRTDTYPGDGVVAHRSTASSEEVKSLLNPSSTAGVTVV